MAVRIRNTFLIPKEIHLFIQSFVVDLFIYLSVLDLPHMVLRMCIDMFHVLRQTFTHESATINLSQKTTHNLHVFTLFFLLLFVKQNRT